MEIAAVHAIAELARAEQSEAVAAAYAGDPGRAYAPRGEAGLMAEYDIATTLKLESVSQRHARVWQIGA